MRGLAAPDVRLSCIVDAESGGSPDGVSSSAPAATAAYIAQAEQAANLLQASSQLCAPLLPVATTSRAAQPRRWWQRWIRSDSAVPSAGATSAAAAAAIATKPLDGGGVQRRVSDIAVACSPLAKLDAEAARALAVEIARLAEEARRIRHKLPEEIEALRSARQFELLALQRAHAQLRLVTLRSSATRAKAEAIRSASPPSPEAATPWRIADAGADAGGLADGDAACNSHIALETQVPAFSSNGVDWYGCSSGPSMGSGGPGIAAGGQPAFAGSALREARTSHAAEEPQPPSSQPPSLQPQPPSPQPPSPQPPAPSTTTSPPPQQQLPLLMVPGVASALSVAGDANELELGVARAERVERSLRAACDAFQLRVDSARADAAALRQRRVRAERLTSLIGRFRCVYDDGRIVLHAPQPALQLAFEQVVCAPSARESRLLSRWLERFGSGGAAPASTVLDFLEYFAKVVASQYGLPPTAIPQLRLCAERLVLPLVHSALFEPCRIATADLDAQLRAQRLWMRQLPDHRLAGDVIYEVDPAEQGVGSEADPGIATVGYGEPLVPTVPVCEQQAEGRGSARQQPLSRRTFAMAIAALSELCYKLTASDLLLCIYRTVRLLHVAAASMSSVSTQAIGADALLPLLVLVTVHAELPHAFACLEYTRRLTGGQHSSSELGYYLACFEAALTYILRASPSDENLCSPQRAAEALGADLGLGGDEGLEERPGSRDVEEVACAAASQGSAMSAESAMASARESGSSSQDPRSTDMSIFVARSELANFLQQESVVDDLVESLTL